MTRVSAKQARERFSDTLDHVRLRRDRVIVQRHGKDVAAVISMEDLALLQELEDRADAKAAKKSLAERDRVAWPKLKAKLGL